MDDFKMDDFAHQHLTAWFDAGHAPNDWDRETLEDFRAWITEHADEFNYDAGWSSIVRQWEAQS